MIGKVMFHRGRRRLEATLDERRNWSCPDPVVERYLNLLPFERGSCECETAVDVQIICCAAEVLQGDPLFLDL